MTVDTNELRGLLAEATPGPWHYAGAHPGYITTIHAAGSPVGFTTGEAERGIVGQNDDAALIVAAVNALPALLDEVERLRALEALLAESLIGWDDLLENMELEGMHDASMYQNGKQWHAAVEAKHRALLPAGDGGEGG